MKPLRLTFGLFFWLAMAATAQAVEIETHTKEETTLTRTKIDEAALWELTPKQWQRYAHYMANTGKYFYKHLDPVFISGLIAETAEERRALAELYARQEFERNRRLIAFQDEFSLAAKRLYPDQALVSLAKLEAIVGDTSRQAKRDRQPRFGDRIALFVAKNCLPCEAAFERHAGGLDDPARLGIALDVYFVGEHKDADIQAWAKRLKVDAEQVRAGLITLNHDDRHQAFGEPELPAAFLIRAGEVVGRL